MDNQNFHQSSMPQPPSLGYMAPNVMQPINAVFPTTISSLPSAPTSDPAPNLIPGSVDIIREFFEVVKAGNPKAIEDYICSLFNNEIASHYLDVSKIVDNNFRHTCLFYAALIKDPDVYSFILFL